MTRAAKIVWFVALAIFLGWLTHRAFGQTFQRSLPFLAKPISVTATNQDPTGSGYLYYRWVASDLPTGPVTNWVDRIGGMVMTNGAVAERPTNGPSGVYFDGSSTHITNSGWTASVGGAYMGTACFIVNPARVNGVYNDVLGNPLDHHSWHLNANALEYTLGTEIAQPVATGLQDWAMAWNPSSGIYDTYTNGIISFTSSSIPAAGDAFYSLGWAGNGYYQGTVLELFWYTNALTSLQVSNFHYYATNTYGYSP